MDIHHNTFFRSILENDSICLTSKTCIRSYLNKGARLRLITRSSTYSFCITHFIFTSTLHFCFNLIQPLTFSLLTCECGRGLNTSNTHLTHCSFEVQWITTHGTIRDIMYTFTWKNGHDIWKEWWYAFTSWTSLWADLYMTREDQVSVVDVVAMNST